MLTKNYHNQIFTIATKKTVKNSIVDYLGVTHDSYSYYSLGNLRHLDYLHILMIDAVDNDPGVRIGSGTTPATLNDYTLEKPITSGCTFSRPSDVAVSAESDGLSAFATYAVTNTGATALGISEIGLFGQIYIGSSSSATVLLDRTVLEDPIVINPGESKQITYTIRFNYPDE